MENGTAKVKKPVYKRWWFILLMVILAIGIVGSIGGGGSSEKPKEETKAVTAEQGKEEAKEEEIMVIDPVALLTEYEANEVKGDELYVKKKMELSGTVDTIGKDLAESVYITFKGDNPYSITSVQCYFDDKAEIAKVMELSQGDAITLVGTCDGKFGNVMIKKCVLK
ncbi:MAG: hypothetical protein RR626_01400 [Anaerovoracaceae bacterium]